MKANSIPPEANFQRRDQLCKLSHCALKLQCIFPPLEKEMVIKPRNLARQGMRGGNRYVTVLYPRTFLRRGYFFALQ